jgi:putative transposase
MWSASSPTAPALVRLVGAVLAEQHDEGTEQRRYLGLDILATSRLTKITNENPIDEEVTITAITA